MVRPLKKRMTWTLTAVGSCFVAEEASLLLRCSRREKEWFEEEVIDRRVEGPGSLYDLWPCSLRYLPPFCADTTLLYELLFGRRGVKGLEGVMTEKRACSKSIEVNAARSPQWPQCPEYRFTDQTIQRIRDDPRRRQTCSKAPVWTWSP